MSEENEDQAAVKEEKKRPLESEDEAPSESEADSSEADSSEASGDAESADVESADAESEEDGGNAVFS